jgi:hypothetical protein
MMVLTSVIAVVVASVAFFVAMFVVNMKKKDAE